MIALRLCLAGASAALLATSAMAQPAAPAAASGWAPIQASGDVVATLQASGRFTRFLSAAQSANLTAILRQQPNITVFAPSDAAFALLPTGTVEQWTSSQQVQGRIAYHIVNTRVPSAALAGKAGAVPAVAGGSLYLDGSKTPPMVNDANIIQADVTTSNGIIHVIDKVLTPGFTPPAAPVEAAPAATPPANK